MPRKDGTGPVGGGLGGQSRPGAGGGRMGGPAAAGSGGFCVCPKCGTKVPHRIAQPCNSMKCPQCGTNMART